MGAGQGRQRRTQASKTQASRIPLPPKEKLFQREHSLDGMKLTSQEVVVDTSEENNGGAQAMLIHDILINIPSDRPGTYHDGVILETQVEKQGILIENGISIREASAMREIMHFSARAGFRRSLADAWGGLPLSQFSDEWGNNFAFVAARNGSGYPQPARIIALLNNTELAQETQKGISNPTIGEYENHCDVLLSLDYDQGKSLFTAFEKEEEYEDEYDLVLDKRRQAWEEKQASILIPKLTPVTF